MIISIHQPNFFPWMPFYDKIKASDVFIFLRHCQYEKNNYQNRFHYRDKWHTMSVNKGLEPIVNKRYMNPSEDWNKIKANLKDKNHILAEYDDCISENLYETNHAIIMKTIRKLNIKTRIEYDSPTELLSTARLIDLCKTYKATTYLAGSGGKKYMDLSKFEQAKINVIFQETLSEQKIHLLDRI